MTVHRFMFATGIENSYPTIKSGSVRVDELEKGGHYKQWETDFALLQDLDIRFLRYGPPVHRTWLAHNRYDWDFADQTFGRLKSLDIAPIVDLCHFGVPNWIGNFQNPDFPALFAEYARAFAERFPWVQLYTPVNEMFVCATFSAAYGWWNEQLANDQAFVTALKHIVKANVLAMSAILDFRPDAIFIQSESSEYFHAEEPDAIGKGGTTEWSPFPVARPQLRPPCRFRDVRVPHGQWDEPRGVSFLPRPALTPTLHHGQ